MVYQFFDEKTGSGAKASAIEELSQELHKLIMKRFKRRRVYARFKDNIWEANLAEMGSFFSEDWGVKYLLCVMDDFTKYVWVKPLKDEQI